MSEPKENPFRMKFCIGTNFDIALLDVIDQHNQDGSITSVFGKVRADWLGGGRPSAYLPDVSMKMVAEYITACHKRNLKFNYLMNPMCYANREFQKRYHRKLLRYLDLLTELGADTITVNSRYICEVIKSRYPHFKVTVGAYALVDTLHKVQYWEALGVDEIQLNRLERNFPLLEVILNHTRTTGTEVRLIANNVCLHDCAWGVGHGTMLSHASRKGEYSKDLILDHYLLRCSYERVKNPVKIISSAWIRPEDVHHYEDLCRKTGNPNLSIKLLDRARTTPFLTRVIKAYTSRSYDGNLIDLLHWASRKEIQKIHLFPAYVRACMSLYNPKLRKMPDLFDMPFIHVDNKKLDGFLDGFINHNECSCKLCDDLGWKGKRCEEPPGGESRCSYCRAWAEKAVSLDEDQVDRWLEQQKTFIDEMVSGELFYATGTPAVATKK